MILATDSFKKQLFWNNRHDEQKEIFKDALNSERSEFVVVYGRKRVGKTYLIKNVLKNRIDFEMTGIQNGYLSDQLENFTEKLTEFSDDDSFVKELIHSQNEQKIENRSSLH